VIVRLGIVASPDQRQSEDAHTHFGRNIGGPMESVGLSNPQLEHLDVLKIEFETARATNPK
jgi:hypothetical protein